MTSFCYCYLRNPAHKKDIVKWLDGHFKPAQTQWYVDKGNEGHETPELNQLLKDISHSRPKTVVVYSLDQVFKSLADGLGFLTDLLRNNGRIVAVDANVDIAGSAAADLLAAIAKMEKDARRKQQAIGIEAAKERGIYKGRKKGTLTLNIDVRRAAKLRQQGWSFDKIAEELNASRSSVARYLKLNPT